MAQQREKIKIEDARIIFRNFAGAAKKFNAMGERNFCVVLTPEDGQDLLDKGYNVKVKPPREEGDDELVYLQVKVNFDNKPPRIVMLADGNKTNLDEDTVELLDAAYIESVDIIFSPYDWKMADGKEGRTAYLQTLFATIEVDDLERKYGVYDTDSGSFDVD